MTPQERDLLSRFLSDLLNTPTGLKDAEAAAMIDNALKARPDAAYALVQHAILADQALHQAQAEIASLRSQAQPAQGQASFLGGAVPPTDPGPWGQRPAAYPQPMQGGGFGGGGLFGGGLGSFMRTAGTMAAGVAAGDMLASGLEGLFGGHRGFGGGYGGGETIINNYYDDDNSSDDSGDWSDNN
jgi:hypothetical protein